MLGLLRRRKTVIFKYFYIIKEPRMSAFVYWAIYGGRSQAESAEASYSRSRGLNLHYGWLIAKADLRALPWARVPQVPVFILNKRPTLKLLRMGEHFSCKIFIILVRTLRRLRFWEADTEYSAYGLSRFYLTRKTVDDSITCI